MMKNKALSLLMALCMALTVFCSYAAAEVITEYTYDKNGNVTAATDQSQTQTGYAYNDNQLSKLASPTGEQVEFCQIL